MAVGALLARIMVTLVHVVPAHGDHPGYGKIAVRPLSNVEQHI